MDIDELGEALYRGIARLILATVAATLLVAAAIGLAAYVLIKTI